MIKVTENWAYSSYHEVNFSYLKSKNMTSLEYELKDEEES